MSHPDRLFPADPGVRGVARDLHKEVEQLPLISPHGHVSAQMLAENFHFADPAELLISPDHYVTRLLHANGIPLEQLRVGGTQEVTARTTWWHFCRRFGDFDGTASGYWLREELHHVLGIDAETINADTADDLYDAVAERIARDGFRPQELLKRFDLEVLATTDDPLDDLSHHKQLAENPDVTTRVIPTFRPDAYINDSPQFREQVTRLIDTAADGLTGYRGYIRALQNRREHFIEHGAVSTDHGSYTPATLKIDDAEAQQLFNARMTGTATAEQIRAFEAHMLYEMARMSSEDKLVMTIHPGVQRNTHPETLKNFGPDTGHDIPFAVNYTHGLLPVLDDFGTVEGFHLIPFTIDETVYSREIAPLAGFYPAVFIGAPWWFLDAPDAMLRFRSAVTETAGFSRSAGFIDDTRALCSIPARHDAARRTEASFLARLVCEHRITEQRAHEILYDLIDQAPRRAFTL